MQGALVRVAGPQHQEDGMGQRGNIPFFSNSEVSSFPLLTLSLFLFEIFEEKKFCHLRCRLIFFLMFIYWETFLLFTYYLILHPTPYSVIHSLIYSSIHPPPYLP